LYVRSSRTPSTALGSGTNEPGNLEYKQLIAEVPPKVIHNEKENRYYLAKLEELNNRWTELTQAERDLYDTIGVLIEDFEKRTYKTRAATPIEAIKELMAANALKAEGSDRGVRDRQLRLLGGSQRQAILDDRPHSPPWQAIQHVACHFSGNLAEAKVKGGR
jgi:antitoxin component HigA of HigAB toxin-antitoxin module